MKKDHDENDENEENNDYQEVDNDYEKSEHLIFTICLRHISLFFYMKNLITQDLALPK